MIPQPTEVLLRVAAAAARAAYRPGLGLDVADLRGAAVEAGLSALPRWDPHKGDLGAYLWTVARRAATRAARTESSRLAWQMPVHLELISADPLDGITLRVDLIAAFERLDVRTRWIVQQRLNGLSYRQIAAASTLSPASVCRRLKNLRRMIA